MSLGLPITISAESKLTTNGMLDQQSLEKIEAWANFETLKANWYGDENRQISVKLVLVSKTTYQNSLNTSIEKGWQAHHKFNALSISVSEHKCTFMFYLNEEHTVNEQNVQQQVHKLLNKAAQQLKLDNI